MISCLHWRNLAPWRLPWRQCQDTFFLFPEHGVVRVSLKGRAFTIRPGQFLMLAENTWHGLELEKGFRRLHQFALHCHIHDRWGHPLISRLSSPTGHRSSRAWGQQALRELACLMSYNPAAGQSRGRTFLRELLAAQFTAGTKLAIQPAVSDPRVAVVLQSMEQELGSSKLSVEALALSVKITPVQ